MANSPFSACDENGVFIFSGILSDETLALYMQLYPSHFSALHDSATEYVVLGPSPKVAQYTTDELQAKNKLPKGWIWKMPERIAVDARSLSDAQQSKIASLRQSCGAEIVGGFLSAALGAERHYPAAPLDQTNLLGSVLASLLPSNPSTWETQFWCRDNAGEWSLATHTAAQIQQVGFDAKSAALSATKKNDTLSRQVAATTTVAGVDAINW